MRNTENLRSLCKPGKNAQMNSPMHYRNTYKSFQLFEKVQRQNLLKLKTDTLFLLNDVTFRSISLEIKAPVYKDIHTRMFITSLFTVGGEESLEPI